MSPSANGGSGSSKFELPALNLNFGSITDGTDIPPPPKSPVEKRPTTPPATSARAEPQIAPAVKKEEITATERPSPSNGNLAGTKRSADDIPPSPTASARPGSLRRLFSRNMLNSSYAEGQQTNGNGNPVTISRPQSRSGNSILDERKSKRSSGWFKRLTSSDSSSKRSSVVLDQSTRPASTVPQKSSGPPPPMIPELKEEESGFGSDLFKNIK